MKGRVLNNKKSFFSVFGCEIERPLTEITDHEEECAERTVKCPFGACKREVQLRKYNYHSLLYQCAIDLGMY